MQKFAIYAQEVLVGHSMLEHGDPPMGVAFGVFLSNAAYATIQRECQTNHADQSSLPLCAKTEAGTPISCAGVAILDYSAEWTASIRMAGKTTFILAGWTGMNVVV